MNIIKQAALYLSFVLVVGCASTGSVSTSQETNQETLPLLNAGEGRIFFYRKPRWAGIVVQPTVELNGEQIGRASPGTYFFVDRPSGIYNVQVSEGKMIQFELLSGEEKYVQMIVYGGGVLHAITPTLVHPDMGKESIRDLSYKGGD